MTTNTAATNRAILANAHAAWHASRGTHSACQALFTAMHKGGVDFPTDFAEVQMEGTTIQVHVEDEIIELDAYGNILRGQA